MSEHDLPRSLGELNLVLAANGYLQEHFGPIAGVYHETQSDLIHLDVHYVGRSAQRPYFTLMTRCMAEKPMHVDGLSIWQSVRALPQMTFESPIPDAHR